MPEPNLPLPSNPVPSMPVETPVSTPPATPSPFTPQTPLASMPAASASWRTSLNLPVILILTVFFLALGLVLSTQLKNFSFLSQTPKPASPGPKVAAKTGELKIGGILPLTGDGASYGIPIQQAAIMAQKEINEKGGIGGRQIKFIWKDGRCEKNAAKAAAEQLVQEEKVEFLLGGACSDEFLASAPISQAQKVIAFSTTATSPKISQLGKYVFRTCPSDILAGKAAAGYAFNKWQAKTAGIIAEDTDYAKALKEVFSQNFTKLGGKVIMAETFATGITDFATASAKAKSLAPDVLYILPQTPTPGVLLVKALKTQGVKSKILTAEVLLIRDAVAEQGKVLEGVTGIETYFDETRPQTKKFLELYKKEYNLEPDYPADIAGVYDFIYLIKAAYEAGAPLSGAGATNTDEVAEWLYGVKKWEGALGTLEFDSHGDPKLAYSIRQISGMAAQQIDTYVPGEE